MPPFPPEPKDGFSSPLLAAAPVGVCAVRRAGRGLEILYVNAAFARMLGTPSPEDLLGKPLDDVWPQGEEGDALIRKLKSPVPPTDYVIEISSIAEEPRWIFLQIAAAPFAAQDALILWATDISFSKAAETSLRRAIAEADDAAGVKANFLATMSHEMRTPMQSVFGLLELIGEEKPDQKIASMVEIAKNSASGLLEILDDVLDLAKMDAEKMELDMFEVPVRTLVRGTLEALAVKAIGRNVTLIDDIDAAVPFVIIGDPKRLRQILMNLAGNALKFTAEGSVTLRVTRNTKTVTPPAHGLALRFEVVDTGIGMNADICQKLFQPFTQADSSTSRKFGGTGLGLSICKKLVDLMGGAIGVESVEGAGSTFWFEIPTEEVGTNASTVDLPSLDGLSVLSVEDHPQGAQEIVRSLQSMGAKVDSVPTCREALDLVRRRPFDVAVIDQGLPDGLGIDLIRKIMEIRPWLGAVMYTVRDDIGLQHTAQSLGVTYLTKPASRLGLGEAIKAAARKISGVRGNGPSRLLIAEDTASVRDVLARQLEKLGVEADFVTDGKQALAALGTGKYGILFTDLHMPEIDGYALVEAIRKAEEEQAEEKTGAPQPGKDSPNSDHFPVIVLTADVQMSQRQVYLRHGFDECLLKPVTLGHLRRLLIRWGLLDSETAAEESALDPSSENPLDSSAMPAQKAAAAQPSQASPAIDRAALAEQMGTFDDSVIEMLGLFIGMTEPLIDDIDAAFGAADWHGVREAAHSLKGAARSACANSLGDLAARLQDDAEAGRASDALVREIKTEFERVRAAIAALVDPQGSG